LQVCGKRYEGHDAPEDGEPAGLDAHAIRYTHAKSAASRQANDMDYLEEACGHPRPGGNKRGQTLRKDLPRAGGLLAKVFADLEQETDALPSTREVGDLARVAAMHARRFCPTQQAARGHLGRNNGHDEQVVNPLKSDEFQSLWQGQGRLHFHHLRMILL
jgi:hypothetical protein